MVYLSRIAITALNRIKSSDVQVGRRKNLLIIFEDSGIPSGDTCTANDPFFEGATV